MVKVSIIEKDSTSDPNAPWIERIQTIRKYVKIYKGKMGTLKKKWFFEHRTFWGTLIPEDKIIYDRTLVVWYGRYFRKKLETGKIKKVCLVRRGHLGDIVMSEPIARFIKKDVEKVYLTTEVTNAKLLFDTYDKC